MLFIEPLVLPDLIKPDVLVIKPSKDMSSIAFVCAEVAGRGKYTRVIRWASPPTKVSPS